MDYKGKIYIIKSNQTELVYIGSTTNKLSNRLTEHKNTYKRYIDGKHYFVSSFDIIKFEDAYIELLEEYTCQNRLALTKREGELIKENDNCVNKFVAGRTTKEYHQDNKEKIKEYKKEYYQYNKEKIREYQKEYMKEYYKQKITCVCGSTFRNGDNSRHLKTKKHLEYIKLTS